MTVRERRAERRSEEARSNAAEPPHRDPAIEIGFGDASREGIAEEMRRDPNVVLMGEDVAEAGTPFKVLKGLVEEFGRERIVDTPISEPGFVGLAVGAAMAGLRPVADRRERRDRVLLRVVCKRR